MSPAKPLLVLLDDLRVDAGERLAFTNDPEGYLASHGWADLDPGDLREALGFVRESMPLDVAVTIPDPTPAEVSSIELVDDYLGAVAPLTSDDDVDLDLEAFGADALPIELDAPIGPADDEGRIEPDLDDEPLTIDLGPDDDLVADDDDDEDDDPLDV
jgi:hypothetical protein